MRILFVSPRQCWPALSGAKLREYHFVRALGRRAELTYVYFADPGENPLTADDLPFCARIMAVPKPRPYGPWNILRGALGRWPLPVLNYTSAAMSTLLAGLGAGYDAGYDLIHLDSIHMIRYAPRASRVIYDWHNIESEAMRRYGAAVPSRSRRMYADRTADKLQALEREILHAAFGHIVCSDREKTQLEKIAPSARIAVIENGVDTAFFAASPGNGGAALLSIPSRVVFVGKMDYHPNIEAAISFAQRIWPFLRERLPGIGLTIVGANPPPQILALGSIVGIDVRAPCRMCVLTIATRWRQWFRCARVVARD
jgi:glycosyltransferase involved in cell wall biosynthesis